MSGSEGGGLWAAEVHFGDESSGSLAGEIGRKKLRLGVIREGIRGCESSSPRVGDGEWGAISRLWSGKGEIVVGGGGGGGRPGTNKGLAVVLLEVPMMMEAVGLVVAAAVLGVGF